MSARLGAVLRHLTPRFRPATGADAHATLDAMRGLSVTFGPSVLLDLFVAGSVATLAREARGRRAGRLIRLVAVSGVALTAAYLAAIRPRMRRWGATPDDLARRLPGDELVPDPAVEATWAVTVDAPIDAVWPWLAQIGQDRGGFYSYEWLENLAGCHLHNADRVHSEWQHREIGEIVPLHPANGLPVVRFEPQHALVLEGWGAFVLAPIDDHRTRLISRSRVPRGRSAIAYALLLEIPHLVMQRKMLLGIKQRAERDSRYPSAHPSASTAPATLAPTPIDQRPAGKEPATDPAPYVTGRAALAESG